MLKRLTTAQLIAFLLCCAALIVLLGSFMSFALAKCGGSAPTSVPAAASADEAKSAALTVNATTDSAPEGTAAPGKTTAPATAPATAPSDVPKPTEKTKTTKKTTNKPTEKTVPQDQTAELKELLSGEGWSLSDLNAVSAAQLVVVRSEGSTAEVTFYERTETGWRTDESLRSFGYLGENGVTDAMAEGKACTPRGLFHIGSAFYQDDEPETGLDAFPITYDTFWVDDPDSPLYNERVVGEEALDGCSAEAMGENPYYRYGFVIEYNMPPSGYAAGSAIFFHISHDSPTLGCVTVSEAKVLAYLARLDAARNPYILII